MSISIDQTIYAFFYLSLTAILTGILAPITLRKYDERKKEVERRKKEEEKQKEEHLKNLMDIERGIKKLIEIVKKDDYKNININDYISDSLIKIFPDNLLETLTELKIDFIELSEWYEVCGYIIYKETKNMFEQITPKFYKNSKHHITTFSNKFYKYYLYVFSYWSIRGIGSHPVFWIGRGLAASRTTAPSSPSRRSRCPYRS